MPGPFADRAFTVAAYRGACIGAIHARLRFYMDAFGTPKAALALARRLPDGEPDLAALRRWIDLVAGAGSPAAFARMLADEPQLSICEARQLAEHWLAQLSPDSPHRADVADAFARRLDARPLALLMASDVAGDFYRDPALQARIDASASGVYGEAGDPAERAHQAARRGDWAAVWAIAEDPTQKEAALDNAFEWLLFAKGADRTRLRAAFEAAIRKHADSRALRERFASFLADRVGDRDAAREELRAILGMFPDGIEGDDVVGSIARLYRLDHRYAESWALVAPRLDGMVGVTMREAIRAQIGLGDLAKAEKLARAYYARYESYPTAASDLAMVLWSQRRWKEAAELITRHPPRDDADDRIKAFSHGFNRVFATKPSGDAEAAFEALVAAGLDYALLQGCIEELRDGGHADTAFALGVLMNFPDGQIQMDTEAYKSLKLARGEAEALAWLRKKMPRSSLPVAAKIFYFRNADELLWTLLDDPKSQGGEGLWTLRAAAYLREKQSDPAHRDTLAQHYQTSRSTFAERVGAAVMGQLDGDALIAEASNESDLATAAYFLGAAAEHAHDLRRAMSLYQLALTTRPGADGARAQAEAAVRRIHDSGFGLEALAAGSTSRAPTWTFPLPPTEPSAARTRTRTARRWR